MRFGHLYQDHVLAPLAEQLLAAVEVGVKAGAVLDVLADGGTLTRALGSAVSFDVEAGMTATDFDPLDADLIGYAADHPVKLEACTQRSLPFADSSFDATFNLVTLGWSDRRLMLEEMRRVTKPGGVVAILGYGSSGAHHERILSEAYAEATGRLDTYGRFLLSDFDDHEMNLQVAREILRFNGAEHFLDVMMQGRNMGANLSSDEMVALRAAIAKRLAIYAVADGTILMPIDVMVATQTT